MALDLFAFDPVDGLRDATEYPDPTTDTQLRAQVQTPSDQIKDYINDTLKPKIETVDIVSVPASKTLALTDAYTLQNCAHATVAIVITVPPYSSVAFPVGTQIVVRQGGVAAVSVAAGAGVTINQTNLKISAQNESAVLLQIEQDKWDFVGKTKA